MGPDRIKSGKCKRLYLFFTALLAFSCSLLIEAGPSNVITVNNAVEFIKALGPDRTIMLEPGTYPLDDCTEQENANVTWAAIEDGRSRLFMT